MFFSPKLNSTAKNVYDVAIVGGGIVGCATARQLKLSKPNLRAVLVEKEAKLAAHQSGHNSGVLHSGIYYVPGSLKARLCVKGIDMAYKFCDEKSIPYKKCGKLIVALNEGEIGGLENLFDRSQKNNCRDISVVDAARIREIEPHCQGIKAIWSPHTGIVDWAVVTLKMAEDFKQMGGDIELGWTLNKIEESNDPQTPIKLIDSKGKEIFASYVITCAGLYSDRIAQLSGGSELPKIIPFRGEYLKLKPEKRYLVKQANIYPVPDPRFPFLGVHFTPTIYGDVILGPNAVMALSREGYNKLDFSAKDFIDSIKYRGTQKLIFKYACYGFGELTRSFYIPAQIKLLQQYIPEITPNDVEIGRTGVRAQALDIDGNLVDEFVYDSGKGPLSSRIIHVRNAPSPAATSSLAIAEMILEKCVEQFGI
ncbi:unnamed protein product [Meloidogyne enterolobii]|uniref:Uncharacterized protein n=1 Tax=Meloidogyne enterolobii TaxID=390850 RepID=A0ACB0YZ69_MELEN